MIREYRSVVSVAGPLVLVEGVEGVKYQELVEIRLGGPESGAQAGAAEKPNHAPEQRRVSAAAFRFAAPPTTDRPSAAQAGPRRAPSSARRGRAETRPTASAPRRGNSRHRPATRRFS